MKRFRLFRILVILAGVMGADGVILAAGAAHLPDATRLASASSMLLSMTSDNVLLPEIYDEADSVIAQKLRQVSGIGEVFIGGGAKPAVRVQVNPGQLNTYGISLENVRSALQSANANRPKGELANLRRAWGIADSDQLFKAREYQPLIVTWRNGAPVKLSDIGSVTDSVEDVRNAGFINGDM